jgi:hypothetical protein
MAEFFSVVLEAVLWEKDLHIEQWFLLRALRLALKILIGGEGSCMRKVGLCYYFGLPIAENLSIHTAPKGALKYVQDSTLTLFDCACSNCRLCEAKRISVF